MAPLALLVVYLGMLGLNFTVRLGGRCLKGGKLRQHFNHAVARFFLSKRGYLGMLRLNFQVRLRAEGLGGAATAAAGVLWQPRSLSKQRRN
jgi:hypothetical protein